jgi:hypothetical protein
MGLCARVENPEVISGAPKRNPLTDRFRGGGRSPRISMMAHQAVANRIIRIPRWIPWQVLTGTIRKSGVHDKGRLTENLFLIELLRRNKSVYFFKNPKECGFIPEERGTITSAIQVCYELTRENRDRELCRLLGAMQVQDLEEGLILTYLQEESIMQDGSTIQLLPSWKWLISGS